VRILVVLLLSIGCGSAAPAPVTATDWALDEPVAQPAPRRPVAAPTDARVVARRLAAAPRADLWRGHRIDVTWDRVELHDAFRMLAEVGDVGIVVSGEVKGQISLRLRRVPWDQVLATVAALERLTVELDGGIYRVQPQQESR
jgi:hypothetical protein